MWFTPSTARRFANEVETYLDVTSFWPECDAALLAYFSVYFSAGTYRVFCLSLAVGIAAGESQRDPR